MNTVLVRRNDNIYTRSAARHRITAKVKRKNAVDNDHIKCDEPKRLALSNLKNATQSYVQHSKTGKGTNINLMVTTVSNRIRRPSKLTCNCTNSVIVKTKFENVERQKKGRKRGAMTTATHSNDKFCQYTTATSMSYRHHQEQNEEQNLPVFKSELGNVSMRRTKIVPRTSTRVQHRYIDIHTLNGARRRSVAIPKDCQHIVNSTSDDDVNALRTSKNESTTVHQDSEQIPNPSIELSTSSSTKSQHTIEASILEESILKANGIEQIIDYDAECAHDPCHVSEYAADIFNYLKEREKKFQIGDYMQNQTSINIRMRAALIDWMALTQENYMLNLETLYLAVKLVDLFLNKSFIRKESLQLLGAAAILLAAKFEETDVPTTDDLVYISDNAFTRTQLIRSEQNIYRAIDYDLGVPLSYQFIRRYARCAKIPMPLLTLARYILETSLMNYALITASESKMAAASLFIALRMTHHNGWNATLEFYSGYVYRDFAAIIPTINGYLHEQESNIEHLTIRKKYSQTAFFKVAQVPLMATEKLIENADDLPIPTTSVAVTAATTATVVEANTQHVTS